jgi:hypothetical protein
VQNLFFAHAEKTKKKGVYVMEKGKAFFVVGHRNWGKSKTLQSLKNGSKKQNIDIKKTKFFIRIMSNDDRPESFVNFFIKLDPNQKPYLIATLCPKFDGNVPDINGILRQLKENYKLFFFVLVHQWHENGNGRITESEIEKLKKFGEVKLYSANDKRGNANVTKAKEFRKYVESKF